MTTRPSSPLAGRPPAQRVEVISGMLALLAGLGAVGYRLFSPVATVYSYVRPSSICPTGCPIPQHESYWTMAHGYPGAWLGLALLVLCVLALLAIGYGAYTHGAFQATRGRLLLWSGTALLVLAIALANLVVTRTQLIPLYLVAPVLLPAAGLALFASGAALPDG